MKRVFLPIAGIIVLLLSITPEIKSKTFERNERNDNPMDTAVIVFLYQGKRIPASQAFEMSRENKIVVYGTVNPKEAVQSYGEKYRNGLYLCYPVKNENNED